jgi:TadE-like protein
MKRHFKERVRQLVAILDGAPVPAAKHITAKGKRRGLRGQSLVEMTITVPVLLVMILGLSEIGFLANNYLIMMDLVREAGRRGSVLNPTLWSGGETRNYNRLDCDGNNTQYNIFASQTRGLARGKPELDAYGYISSATDTGKYGFFDAVVCQAMLSMAPLEFEDLSPWTGPTFQNPPPRNAELFSKNDFIVSAITYTRMIYDNAVNPDIDDAKVQLSALPANRVWITVTGRWPMENRFCRRIADGKGDNRDPFDFKRADYYSDWKNNLQDPGEINGILGLNSGQNIRGFVFTGKYVNPEDDCLGSRLTVQDLETRLNQDFANDEIGKKVPNGAAVIVEMHWQHHPVLLGPLLNMGVALFQGSRPDDRRLDPVLYVYAIFPVASAEPTATPE